MEGSRATMRLPQFLLPSLSCTAPPTKGPANSSIISAMLLPLYDLHCTTDVKWYTIVLLDYIVLLPVRYCFWDLHAGTHRQRPTAKPSQQLFR